MKDLKAYVERKNRYLGLFGFQLLEYKTQKGRDTIRGDVRFDLSPENLHCDGEISKEEAFQKYRHLQFVLADLDAYERRLTFKVVA